MSGLTVSKFKLSAQVKKATTALQITVCSDSTVDFVVENLLLNYRDYQLEPQKPFTDLVRDLMSVYLPVEKIATSSNGGNVAKSLSLNQSISQIHRGNGVASKRSRPDDGSTVPTNAGEDKNGDGDSAEAMDTDASASAKIKKRKANAPNEAAIRQQTLNKLSPPSSGGFVVSPSERPPLRFADLAGLDTVITQVKELVCFPIQFLQLYNHLGVCPPCGILLHGPSGCGKTTLAAAIAGETNLPYFKVSGPELVGGTSGESEERIRQIFEAAAMAAPSVLFIDALDVIAAKKDSSTRGMDRRIIAQLFDSIDYISSLGKVRDGENGGPEDPDADQRALIEKKNRFVILIVATNKPDNIDPGVRGRFAREIALPVPDAPARAKILQLHTSKMNLAPTVDFSILGKMTPGFVGSDLQALARESGMIAVCRIIKQHPQLLEQLNATATADNATKNVKSEEESMDVEEKEEKTDMMTELLQTSKIEMEDFIQGTKTIQPTAKREGFAVAPEVTWNDVGALAEVREELKHNVLEPIAHPERFRALGLDVPAGVLFYGPPGCGKTLLAKALANQSGANFISVKGPELLNMFVGESESRVRQVFARARASAPCVIFFDELDALCPKRSSGWEGSSGGGGGGNNVSERVVNQLLTELDGLESRKDVYIIAATNRLELIDDAMLRPGRLGNLLYVPLPSSSDRASILKALTRKVALDEFNAESNPDGVNLEEIGFDPRAEGFSGADLAALVREAGLSVIKEISDDNPFASSLPSSDNGVDNSKYNDVKIKKRHFEAAFTRVRPSVNPQDRSR